MRVLRNPNPIVSWLLLAAVVIGSARAQTPGGDEIDKLRSKLELPGPEALEARHAAVDALVQMADARAHALLQDKLLHMPADDPLREAVLTALQRELRRSETRVFAGGEDSKALRTAVVRSWATALLPFWRGELDADDRLPPDPLREAARACIVRLPPGELEAALRELLPTLPPGDQEAAMLLAADTQNLLFAPLLAEQIEAESMQRRIMARVALRRLCFVAGGFASRADFAAWWEKNGRRRYVDLAEEAARTASATVARSRSELQGRLQKATVDLVSIHVRRPVQVDWPKVQDLVLANDPPGTTDECLRAMRDLLQDFAHAESQDLPRQAFYRALRQQFLAAPATAVEHRALLLEVSSLLVRVGDAELASEVDQMLQEHLLASDDTIALAALRGLRRFPSPSARSAVVAVGLAAAKSGERMRPRLREVLRTLGRRGEPRWRAPANNDVDKPEWSLLLRTVLQRPDLAEICEDMFAMALQTDAKDERVPEAFELLLGVAVDPLQPFANRSACLLHLRDFCSREANADGLLHAAIALLADAEPRMRQFATSILAQLPDLSEAKKRDWIRAVIEAVRGRLLLEPDAGALSALCDCLVVCAGAPGTPEPVIAALGVAIEDLKKPVVPEHQFRLEPLLKVAVTIGNLPTAKPGSWLLACKVLLLHERRRNLRLLLESQHAVRLARDVRDQDEATADAARRAMLAILYTALLKPGKDNWCDLREEANDVRSAFAALDSAQVTEVESPELRLLRLAALNGLGAAQAAVFREVLQLGEHYLTESAPKGRAPLDSTQRSVVRLLLAEAHLGVGELAEAAAALNACDPATLTTPAALILMERLGRAFAEAAEHADPHQGLVWLERALRDTADSDVRFRKLLLAVAKVRIQIDAGKRGEVLAMLDQHAGLFGAADCPQELKDAFAKLRIQLQ